MNRARPQAPSVQQAPSVPQSRRGYLFAGTGHLVGGVDLDFDQWRERIRPAIERAMRAHAARVRAEMRKPRPAGANRSPWGKVKRNR
jgi:hypothetical protein